MGFAREAVQRRLRDDDWGVVCAALEITSDAHIFPAGASNFGALVAVARRGKEELLSGAAVVGDSRRQSELFSWVLPSLHPSHPLLVLGLGTVVQYCAVLCGCVVLTATSGAGKGGDGPSSKAVKRGLRLCFLRLEAMLAQDSEPEASERTLQLASLLLPFLVPRPKVSAPSTSPPALTRLPLSSVGCAKTPPGAPPSCSFAVALNASCAT